MTTIEQLHDIPIQSIVPSRWQPRAAFDEDALLELAKHIHAHGLMYPIILFLNEDGEHELVAGERRTRAITALELAHNTAWTNANGNGLRVAVAHLATHNWQQLPEDVRLTLDCTITARIEPNGDYPRLHQLAVADNIQRCNLSPLEEARALQDLIDEQGLSQRQLADQIGWSQSKLQERLALLKTAPEVQDALTTRAVSTSHLRHLSRVPQELQPAVVRHVVELINREGDHAATVRQVAVLTSQVREFVNPARWTPGNAPLLPELRNRLRLIHHLVTNLHLDDQVAQRLLALRDTGWEHNNLLGKQPGTLIDSLDLCTKVVDALLGTNTHLFDAWDQFATAQGWTCDRCQLCGTQHPPPNPYDYLCDRWKAQENGEDPLEILTCSRWQGPGQDLTLPIKYELRSWVETLELEGMTTTPFSHFTDLDRYVAALTAAETAKGKQIRQAQLERERAHLAPLRAYCDAQRPGQPFAAEHCFHAHRCDRCLNYRPDLLEQDLPPCHYALEPLTGRYPGNNPTAPNFGVLVDSAGRQLPRCAQYRARWDWLLQALLPSPGFTLPDRNAVAQWIGRIATGRLNQTTHRYTLPGPLAWLPYKRETPEQPYDVSRLIRFIKRKWDQLGDEGVATLVTALAYDVKAGNRMGYPFILLDPSTGEPESWAAVEWDTWRRGKDLDHWDRKGWPKGWPKPWLNTTDQDH